MNLERLVVMANDIGSFFGGEPTAEERIAGVSNHLAKFWDPRMRRQIVAYAREGGADLSDHVRAAVLRLDIPPKN
jgi:formate dehydrogenase subunit delta